MRLALLIILTLTLAGCLEEFRPGGGLYSNKQITHGCFVIHEAGTRTEMCIDR